MTELAILLLIEVGLLVYLAIKCPGEHTLRTQLGRFCLAGSCYGLSLLATHGALWDRALPGMGTLFLYPLSAFFALHGLIMSLWEVHHPIETDEP